MGGKEQEINKTSPEILEKGGKNSSAISAALLFKNYEKTKITQVCLPAPAFIHDDTRMYLSAD